MDGWTDGWTLAWSAWERDYHARDDEWMRHCPQTICPILNLWYALTYDIQWERAEESSHCVLPHCYIPHLYAEPTFWHSLRSDHFCISSLKKNVCSAYFDSGSLWWVGSCRHADCQTDTKVATKEASCTAHAQLGCSANSNARQTASNLVCRTICT